MSFTQPVFRRMKKINFFIVLGVPKVLWEKVKLNIAEVEWVPLGKLSIQIYRKKKITVFTVCPRRFDPFYVVGCNIKWLKIFGTYSRLHDYYC